MQSACVLLARLRSALALSRLAREAPLKSAPRGDRPDILSAVAGSPLDLDPEKLVTRDLGPRTWREDAVAPQGNAARRDPTAIGTTTVAA